MYDKTTFFGMNAITAFFYVYVGIASGIYLPLLSIKLILGDFNELNNQSDYDLIMLKLATTIAITSFISIIGTYFLKQSVKKSATKKTLLTYCTKYATTNLVFKWYTWFVTLFNIPPVIIVFLIWLSLKSVNTFLIYVFITIFFLFLITPVYNLAYSRFFEHTLKNSINNKYKHVFPYLKVITQSGSEVYGKVADVFDEKTLILGDSDYEKIIQWDSVTALEIYSPTIDYNYL